MAHDTTEIYVRNLTEADAVDWLESVFDAVEKTRDVPILTYHASYDGGTVPVQVTERVQGKDFTSVWFNSDRLPWDDTQACARSAHDATGRETLCYPDRSEDEPWKMLRLTVDSGAETVDERELDDF